MNGESFKTLMMKVKAGIKSWTRAVFGSEFVSKGRKYKIGTQKDSHSCGICVINAFYASILNSELFDRQARSRYRLDMFIAAGNYLLEGRVRLLPAVHGSIYSLPG